MGGEEEEGCSFCRGEKGEGVALVRSVPGKEGVCVCVVKEEREGRGFL